MVITIYSIILRWNKLVQRKIENRWEEMNKLESILVICDKIKNDMYYQIIDSEKISLALCNQPEYLQYLSFFEQLNMLIIDLKTITDAEIVYLISFFQKYNSSLEIVIVRKRNQFGLIFKDYDNLFFVNNKNIDKIMDRECFKELHCLKKNWWHYFLKDKGCQWTFK